MRRCLSTEHELEILFLKLFTVSEFTALADKEFQSLIVPEKNEFLYTLYFRVCGNNFPYLIDGLVLNAM